ncbi:MAG: hypothetical protein V2J89_02885, partial [Halieaceae bacterium]|nr:hypothetical protein [Halieaceae bacterium]
LIGSQAHRTLDPPDSGAPAHQSKAPRPIGPRLSAGNRSVRHAPTLCRIPGFAAASVQPYATSAKSLNTNTRTSGNRIKSQKLNLPRFLLWYSILLRFYFD